MRSADSVTTTGSSSIAISTDEGLPTLSQVIQGSCSLAGSDTVNRSSSPSVSRLVSTVNVAEVAPPGTRTCDRPSLTSPSSVSIPAVRTTMSASRKDEGIGTGLENRSVNSTDSPSGTRVRAADSVTVEPSSSSILTATEDGLPAFTSGGSAPSDTVNRSWWPSASWFARILPRPLVAPAAIRMLSSAP